MPYLFQVCPKRVFLGIGIVGIPTIFLAYRQFGLGNVVLGSVATGVIAFVLYRILKKKSNWLGATLPVSILEQKLENNKNGAIKF